MKAAVIGVGTRDRHDSGVGPEVIDRLAEMGLKDVTLAVVDHDPERVVDLWADLDVGVLVHAVRADPTHPGKIHELIVDSPLASRCRSAASPELELSEVIELARTLGRMPGRLIILAVEGSDFSPGVGLSPAVDVALDRVVRLAVQTVAIAYTRG